MRTSAGDGRSAEADPAVKMADLERALLRKLSQRIAGSITSYSRRTPNADPREKARDFLENLDWHLPEDLAELGSAARAFPELVSDSVAELLDESLDFVSAYLSICGHVLASAGSRWLQQGRPRRNAEVLAGLLQRAMTATNETFALLERGFPDGAEARMRTVVELGVIATFIERSSTEIAKRFEASHHVEMWRRKEDDHIRGLTAETIQIIDKQYQRVIQRHGVSMARPYGWASPAFDNRRVTYADISRAYGNVVSSSRFSNASHHVHASHSGSMKSAAADSLGVFLHGPPVGFYMPAYECMDSLHQSATAFLRAVRSSRRNVELVYWTELLHYTMKEAQLQITHAQAVIDPEWARRSIANLPELDIDGIFLKI
ncbi:DUF5677 domain-containing protein [uncultured Microbacterium sp.]|uniref:DUF5677 domain-containing protein n=1 Tax=uncultured Microbacterium sp. TaxID=191216 RepID=UPI0028EB9C3E|nr:DUF5677 domain-containing protein [uncultured Microbacterium sp.]